MKVEFKEWMRRLAAGAGVVGLLCLSACLQPEEAREGDKVWSGRPATELSLEDKLRVRELMASAMGVHPDSVYLGKTHAAISDMALSYDAFKEFLADSSADLPVTGRLAKSSQRQQHWDCQIPLCPDVRPMDRDEASYVRVLLDENACGCLGPYVDEAIRQWNASGAELFFERVYEGNADVIVYEVPEGETSCGPTKRACADAPYNGDAGDWIEIETSWSEWEDVPEVMIHEFGHIFGLGHTDRDEDYDKHIPGTPWLNPGVNDDPDPYSIMNAGIGWVNDITNWDQTASRVLYPLNMHVDKSGFGDVDGDGKRDLILITDRGVSVALQNGSGTLEQPTVWSKEFGMERGWEDDRHPRYFADVNGDGKTDIVGFGAFDVQVGLSLGDSFDWQTWHSDFGFNDDGWNNNTTRLVADVNGDGKADLIGFGYNNVEVALSTGTGFGSKTAWHTDYGINDGWDGNTVKRLADVNGDGKADVVGFGYNGVEVALSSGSGFGSKTYWHTDYGYNDGWDASTLRVLADVTGDGKADLVGFGYNNTYISPSNGSSFVSQSTAHSNFGVNDGWTHSHVRKLADMNNDGKADIIAMGANDTYVYLSNGSSFSSGGVWSSDYASNDGWNAETPRLVADVNNDGKADLITLGPKIWKFNTSTGSGFSTSTALTYRED